MVLAVLALRAGGSVASASRTTAWGTRGLAGAPRRAPTSRVCGALSVAANGLTAGGAALLSGAPPQLEELDLSANPLGRRGGPRASRTRCPR